MNPNSSGEQIRDGIEHMLTLVIQYVEEKMTKEHISGIETTCENLGNELQQAKAYILGFEERINKLEQENVQLRNDLQQAGMNMANLSESNKNIQQSLVKKRKFWK